METGLIYKIMFAVVALALAGISLFETGPAAVSSGWPEIHTPKTARINSATRAP
jgi:hypothetical protein